MKVVFLRNILVTPEHGEANEDLASILSPGKSVKLLDGKVMNREELLLEAKRLDSTLK